MHDASSGVRHILMKDHGCGLKTDPVLGMRATVDDNDLLATQMVSVSKRLRSTQQMFTATSDLIDDNKLTSGALKSWYKANVVPVVRAINTTDFTTKLLPPKKDEGSK